jgi:hypothetical protein
MVEVQTWTPLEKIQCNNIFEPPYYRNPSLGFVAKAKACKGTSQEGSPGVTSHVPRSVGECEGMNTHTPK